jgi:hypothetical protein
VRREIDVRRRKEKGAVTCGEVVFWLGLGCRTGVRRKPEEKSAFGGDEEVSYGVKLGVAGLENGRGSSSEVAEQRRRLFVQGIVDFGVWCGGV